MSRIEYTPLEYRAKRTYTFDEAIDLMKALDKLPTNTRTQITWVSVRTGKPIIIGYNN